MNHVFVHGVFQPFHGVVLFQPLKPFQFHGVFAFAPNVLVRFQFQPFHGVVLFQPLKPPKPFQFQLLFQLELFVHGVFAPLKPFQLFWKPLPPQQSLLSKPGQLLQLFQGVFEGDQPFGIVVYGYGRYTSYMYPGGLNLNKL